MNSFGLVNYVLFMFNVLQLKLVPMTNECKITNNVSVFGRRELVDYVTKLC